MFSTSVNGGVGVLVGDDVLGVIVGCIVGLGVVGCEVGVVVGNIDGEAEAVTVGAGEGLVVGEEVGAPHSMLQEQGQENMRASISSGSKPMAPSTAQSKVTCCEQGSWSLDLKVGSSRHVSSHPSGQVETVLIGRRPRSERDLLSLVWIASSC